jgi:serine palmitoyltransferase
MILVLKPEVVASKGWSIQDQTHLLQDAVDEVSDTICIFVQDRTDSKQCLANGVLVTRLKAYPLALGANPRDGGWQPTPAIKLCVTSGLTKKETEKAGITIRHAITKIVKSNKWSK